MLQPPCWAEDIFVHANFSERIIVFMESSYSSIQLELHDFLTTKKTTIAVQKHLNASTSLYANFLTAIPVFVFIGAESLQPPYILSPLCLSLLTICCNYHRGILLDNGIAHIELAFCAHISYISYIIHFIFIFHFKGCPSA